MKSASIIKLAPVTPLHPKKSHIYLVASGKGGVGKTWCAISLGLALAQTGQHALIFDGDLGLANIDIQLGLATQRDLRSFLDGSYPLSDVISTYKDSTLDILPGRSGNGDLATLPPEKLEFLKLQLLRLAHRYDALFIDLGAGIETTVKALADMAATCLLVITDEPTSLTDAYAVLKILRRQHRTLQFQILVNQAESVPAGQQTYETFAQVCETFMHFKPSLLGIVRRDPHVKDSIRSQTPTSEKFPQCDATLDIKRIAEKFALAS